MPSLDLGPVVGPQGAQGAMGAQGQRGEQGLPGPNVVGGATATPLTGVLTGNGSVVGVANIDTAPTANSTGFAQSGGTNKAIKGRVPVNGMGKNLLRNWYFVGGGTGRGVFPVNQRGKTSYSGDTSIFDGWTADANTSIAFGSAGIAVSLLSGSSTSIYQRAGKAPLGQSITMSILTGNGLVSVSGVMPSTLPSSNQAVLTVGTSADGYRFNLYLQPAGTMYVEFRAYTTQTWVAAKLELGTEQTLCHNEGTDANPVWVLNEIPDYEYELYRCKTSTADPADIYANKVLSTNLPNKNLLDNWYFGNPVNQRGQSSYGAVGYTIDRWRIENSSPSLSVASNGVTFGSELVGGQFLQKIESYKLVDGETYTLSALCTLASGSATIKLAGVDSPYPDFGVAAVATGLTSVTFTLNRGSYSGSIKAFVRNESANGSVIVHAMKLELGTEQTLAHQENGTWVLNEIPDYGEELRKCQRYYFSYQIPSGAAMAVVGLRGDMATGTNMGAQIDLPVVMARVPTVDAAPHSIRGNGSIWNTGLSVTSTPLSVNANHIAIEVLVSGASFPGLTSGYAVLFSRLNLSAEL